MYKFQHIITHPVWAMDMIYTLNHVFSEESSVLMFPKQSS